MDGMLRTVAHDDWRRPPENEYLHRPFFEWLATAAPAPLLEGR
jgi:hypothetical protein